MGRRIAPSLVVMVSLCVSGHGEKTACVENTYTREGLAGWEKELLRDCPTSAMGAVTFDTSSTDALAESHFVLGLKALHNFFYDVCKVEFQAAIAAEPTLADDRKRF